MTWSSLNQGGLPQHSREKRVRYQLWGPVGRGNPGAVLLQAEVPQAQATLATDEAGCQRAQCGPPTPSRFPKKSIGGQVHRVPGRVGLAGTGACKSYSQI